MRNEALERVATVLVGEWTLTISEAWWEEPGTVREGEAIVEWLDDGFLVMRASFEGKPTWLWVFGRNDAQDRFVANYHDDRGVLRVFDMTWEGPGGAWDMLREDPDFHQRFVGRIAADGRRIDSHPDVSEDRGATWRKDFDLTFVKRP